MNYSKRRVRHLTPERKKEYNTNIVQIEKFICLFVFIFIILWYLKLLTSVDVSN